MASVETGALAPELELIMDNEEPLIEVELIMDKEEPLMGAPVETGEEGVVEAPADELEDEPADEAEDCELLRRMGTCTRLGHSYCS